MRKICGKYAMKYTGRQAKNYAKNNEKNTKQICKKYNIWKLKKYMQIMQKKYAKCAKI